MGMTLDTDLLQTFVAIADSGGFTRAAEVVHRSQSAVSMQMKKLEEILGQSLFEKSGRGVSLTRDGEILLNYARRILKLHEEAVVTLRRPDIVGAVRIGIPDDYVAAYLPGILTSFASAYPLVQVEVVCEPSEYLLKWAERGEVDLAIVTEFRGSETGQILRREATVWASSRSHLAHEVRPLPLVLFQQGCIFRTWAIKALEDAGIEHRIAYSSPSITGIETIVGAGLGVTVLVRSILNADMLELGAKEGFPDLPDSVISLLRSPASATAPAIATLADFIVKHFKQYEARVA
ncbi:MAG: LysR family transcriptional regulator [Gammaproteobacteria bacterium]|nr:LysR family transcriptional regulator [Gammaproteobacteria bacterium]